MLKKYTHIKARIPKLYPIYDQNQLNSIPYLWPKRLKNHTLWGLTYLYSPYKGVLPPPPLGPKNRFTKCSLSHCVVSIIFWCPKGTFSKQATIHMCVNINEMPLQFFLYRAWGLVDCCLVSLITKNICISTLQRALKCLIYQPVEMLACRTGVVFFAYTPAKKLYYACSG